MVRVLEDEGVAEIGDRIRNAVAVIVVARVVIADVLETEGVSGLVQQRLERVASGHSRIEVRGLETVDENVTAEAPDLVKTEQLVESIVAVDGAGQKCAGARRRMQHGIHVNDVGLGSTRLLEVEGDQVVPELNVQFGAGNLLRAER